MPLPLLHVAPLALWAAVCACLTGYSASRRTLPREGDARSRVQAPQARTHRRNADRPLGRSGCCRGEAGVSQVPGPSSSYVPWAYTSPGAVCPLAAERPPSPPRESARVSSASPRCPRRGSVRTLRVRASMGSAAMPAGSDVKAVLAMDRAAYFNLSAGDREYVRDTVVDAGGYISLFRDLTSSSAANARTTADTVQQANKP